MTSKEYIEDRAMKRAQDRIEFLSHLFMYVLINSFLIALNMYSSPENKWFIFPLFFWGIGLVGHGLSVFVLEDLFANLKQRFYEQEVKKLKNR